nr:hypothetical protein [Sporomusa ovata]
MVVRRGDEACSEIKKLTECLLSSDVKKFIQEK